MFKVIRPDDVKLAYILLRMREEGEAKDWLRNDEHIVNLKKELRRYYRELPAWHKEFLTDDYDGCWIKVVMPENIRSKEGAEGFYESYLKREWYPSQYDCTGQHCTGHEKYLQRTDGRWIIFFYEAVDV